MRLELSAFVETDLDAIAAFIADDSPGLAEQMAVFDFVRALASGGGGFK